MYVCLFVCIYVCNACIYVWMNPYMCVDGCVSVYLCIHACLCVCVCVFAWFCFAFSRQYLTIGYLREDRRLQRSKAMILPKVILINYDIHFLRGSSLRVFLKCDTNFASHSFLKVTMLLRNTSIFTCVCMWWWMDTCFLWIDAFMHICVHVPMCMYVYVHAHMHNMQLWCIYIEWLCLLPFT